MSELVDTPHLSNVYFADWPNFIPTDLDCTEIETSKKGLLLQQAFLRTLANNLEIQNHATSESRR